MQGQASKITMHMEHKAGDKMFVDFAGEKLFIVCPKTGEKTDLEVAVAILGASQRSYVEASAVPEKPVLDSCQ